MYKLKRSRLVKTLCFVFALFFLLAGALNIAFIVFCVNQNLMNIDESAFSKKIYSFPARWSADEAVQYYDLTYRRGQIDENTYYYDSEIEVYQSYFSKQNCSIGFVIQDEAGKTLLSNYEVKNPLYTYKRNFSHYENNSSSYVYTEEYATAVTEPEATTETESISTAPIQGKSRQRRGEEETTRMPDGVENTTRLADDEGFAETTTLEISHNTVGEDKNSTGKNYGFLYHYDSEHGDYDTRIHDYCYALFMSTDYSAGVSEPWLGTINGDNVVFFEDNYSVDKYSNVTPKKTVEYQVDSYRTYSVTVYVPQTDEMLAKDMYYYINGITHFAYGYKEAVIPLTVIYFLLSAGLYILLLCLCGYKKDTDAPVAAGFHRFPLDVLTLLLCITTVCAYGISMDAGREAMAFISAGIFVASGLAIFCHTLTVRIKAKTVMKGLFSVWLIKTAAKLIRRLWKGAVHIFKKLTVNMHILAKFGIVYAIIAVVGFLACVWSDDGGVWMLYFFGLFLLIPIFLLLALNMNTLLKFGEALANGLFSEKLQDKFLFGEFKKHAENLNAVSGGIDKAVKERIKSESMKTELITNVSHDLKTPLTSIVNYVDLLKKEEIGNEKAREYIEVIDRQAQKLKKLTFDIVEASKAATGNLEVHFEPTVLNVLLTQMEGEYTEKLTKANLSLVMTLPEENITILADGRLLWRVLDNLMSNICKYSQPGTRVYVTLSTNDNQAEVMFRNISDAPLNISPDELTERFVRGDLSRNTEGSGLGLSIAQSLVKSMNGKFEIDIDGDLFKASVRFVIAGSR